MSCNIYMIENIYKNPILHGLLGAAFSGLVLYLINNRNSNKKKKKRPDVIPVIIFGLLVWFASSNYLNCDDVLLIPTVNVPLVNVADDKFKSTLLDIQMCANNTIDELKEIPGIGDVIIR